MVHCQECQATLATAKDIEFRETDSKLGVFRASKRFYVIECANCGKTIGSGVAGAKAGGDAA